MPEPDRSLEHRSELTEATVVAIEKHKPCSLPVPANLDEAQAMFVETCGNGRSQP